MIRRLSRSRTRNRSLPAPRGKCSARGHVAVVGPGGIVGRPGKGPVAGAAGPSLRNGTAVYLRRLFQILVYTSVTSCGQGGMNCALPMPS